LAVLAGLLLVPSCTLDRSGSMSGEPDAGVALGECQQPAECPGRFLDCSAPTCDNTTCGTWQAEAGTECDDGDDEDDKVCNGQGLCVQCTQDSDCDGTEICETTTNECVPAHCSDGELNGGETDLDCGGPCGRTCVLNETCDDWGDCVTGVCAGGLCSPCSVTEDCVDAEWCDAGICITRRPVGDACSDAEQCLSGHCPEDGVCCNQDCLGTCMACIPGQTGLGYGECGPVLQGEDFANECPAEDPSTCGRAGTGCDGAGACILYADGTVCVPASCTDGIRDEPRTCNGDGFCRTLQITDCGGFQCDGADCRTYCDNNTHCLPSAFCNSSHQCEGDRGLGSFCSSSSQCDSGYCRDNRCCENDCAGECMACSSVKTGETNGRCRAIVHNTNPDGECSNGACYRFDSMSGECRWFQGHSCGGSSGECFTLSCVDGYCCENSCTGLCRSCDGSKTPGNNGQCRFITNSTDPDSECEDAGSASCGSNGDGCDGAGQCILYPATQQCVAETCNGTSWDPADFCNGSGLCIDTPNQSCSPYTCGSSSCRSTCTDQSHCVSSYWCNGSSQCVAEGGNGTGCVNDYECTSDSCVDSVCCDGACTGFCMSCLGAETGGSDGTCGNVQSGRNPDGDCPSGACDGNGKCEDGTDCSSDSSICGSTHCVDGFCCNSACTGACEACRGDWTTPDDDGTCNPITDGTDPKLLCPDGGSGGSGTGGSGSGGGGAGLLGTCDGARSCE
jgi:hypothetical protein